ncbi:MAG TPA: cytochrome c biogenesis protein CcdA [Planctomycetota bacterium]|nr:cytochrome c biogenesis protein CcdA [Planctomycetota bacterium]
MKRTLLKYILLAVVAVSGVVALGGNAFADFEKMDAFQVSVSAARITSDTTAEVDFVLSVAKGHYVYRDKMKAAVKAPDGVTLDELIMPPAKRKTDPYLEEEVEIYGGRTQFTAKLKIPAADAVKEQGVSLEVGYQGCSKDTCFFPMKTELKAEFGKDADEGQAELIAQQPGEPPVAGASNPRVLYNVTSLPTVVFTDPHGTEYAGERVHGKIPAGKMIQRIEKVAGGQGDTQAQSQVESWLAQLGTVLTFAVVFGFGLLVTFTPCVWPMIPVTTSIVLGSKRPGTGMGLLLSASYVLGLSLVYAILGLITATAGGLIGASLQSPWVLGAVAGLFVAMALSMFGLYELPLLTVGAGRFGGGGVLAALVLGGVSAVVLSPCVGPVAASLLAYVAGTGNALLGTSLLFVFGLGMGVPLIAIGAFSGTIKKLPRSGPWMLEVRKLFGVILIGLAIWFLFPLMGERLGWIVSGIAAIAVGIGFIIFDARKALGSLLGRAKLASCVLAIAVGLWAAFAAPAQVLPAGGIKWYPSLAEAQAAAIEQNKPMMIDFTADWCTVCKEMDKYVFRNKKVMKSAEKVIAVRIDLTSDRQQE